ncbi:MAG: glutamine-synthetase adenylyltransferase [Bryobacterales bacterium]|jgi:glutamate-ammonia-ligase adenylyltransferase|nr:glutamine-synthetase adenylyltransferase [Bryobacterales bacterium]
MDTLLHSQRFQEPDKAASTMQAFSEFFSPEIVRKLHVLLATSPQPDQVLHYLDRMLHERRQVLLRLGASPSGLQAMIAVFGHSRFLSDAVLRTPEWLEELLNTQSLDTALTADQFEWRLENAINAETSGPPSPEMLARFRRKQLLRIVLRDVYEVASVAEVAEELSNLADAILRVTCQRIYDDLVRRFGQPFASTVSAPQGDTGDQAPAPIPCYPCILALGKLGGRELNYSSDIDLMFFYTANGETDGPRSISNKEFFQKLSHLLCDTLSTYTPEGMCYRVDMRLRPEGSLGEICISLDAAKAYYKNRARDWELQMLLKARAAAGSPDLGAEFFLFVEPLIYSTTLDFKKVEAVSETRLRIQEKASLQRRSAAHLDVKLQPGGIRDIEFLVQCLQRLHGGRDRFIRHGGTLMALFRLHSKGYLSDAEYAVLASAYQFLRNAEHRLQFDHDRQVHVLPEDPAQLQALARKMPHGELGLAPTAEDFLSVLRRHLAAVLSIHARVIHSQQSAYFTEEGPRDLSPLPVAAAVAPDGRPAAVMTTNALRFLDQKAPQVAQQLRRRALRRGHHYLEAFAETIVDHAEWLALLDGEPASVADLLLIFELSPFFSEQILRRIDFVSQFLAMRNPLGSHIPYAHLTTVFEEPGELRGFYHRELFRILAESICLSRPIFETLARCSELADAAIETAYRIALAQTLEKQKPSNPAYQPHDQMMVIAMGRLGMLEFDLASDADLLFVLPPKDANEIPFWRSVAQRIISLLSSYTAEGLVFAVDTRLRPDGRSGSLVQTVDNYRAYFESRAEAWEGLAFMKSRPVAGDSKRCEAFLAELQQVDWRRWGQSGRSRLELARMRARLEQEQGSDNPLKSGRGGFYDIDFALLYLRLRGAGIYFPVLNTLQRIDVVEKMGHLERSDAEFLRDAATFYRALDHGMRISTGKSGGKIPTTGPASDILVELLQKWVPDHLQDQPLSLELAQIQDRTSAYFQQLFRIE